MWLKWLPWKFVFRKLALYHGFADPIAIMSHIRRFSQPSEVSEPIELLRAGVVFHARGLINGRVIQHNMDWIWPYWINRQFNPRNEAFIPGAVSFSHVNLSGRNWTAVGLPDFGNYPIVDPRGLITPFWDSWSIDAWIVSEQGRIFAPARMNNVEQFLDISEGLSIITRTLNDNFLLESRTEADFIEDKTICRIKYLCKTTFPGFFAISLRPCNPEGISFIHEIEFDRKEIKWCIDKKYELFLNKPPDKHIVSDYHHGDVALKLLSDKESDKITCNVGMATAAAFYKIQPDTEFKIQSVIGLNGKKIKTVDGCFGVGSGNVLWKESLGEYCRLNLSWDKFQYIYDAAVRAIILHSPSAVYPGPFTYKRFWFRDAALIVNAMLSLGLTARAEKVINGFFDRQKSLGYFHSQEGEWDSNGQVLWVMNRFCQLTASKPKQDWILPIIKGARWIIRKRLKSDNSNLLYSGLMPAGFSAEHLGPSDFYYWDDFWSVAGLYAAAQMLDSTNHPDQSHQSKDQADDLLHSIENSLKCCRGHIPGAAMPASPNRRLDSGAIGSLAACYPTQLFSGDDERIGDTADYLMRTCIMDNCFYHVISHSGINPYLTLHLAQVLMRRGDVRFADLVNGVAMFASPTGQWPEAANPRIKTGCMGDGQHIWACAEWVMMMINCFVIEENGKLILCKGIIKEWLKEGTNISIGPVRTSFGSLVVTINRSNDKIIVNWQGKWFKEKPQIKIELPGSKKVAAESEKTSAELEVL